MGEGGEGGGDMVWRDAGWEGRGEGQVEQFPRQAVGAENAVRGRPAFGAGGGERTALGRRLCRRFVVLVPSPSSGWLTMLNQRERTLQGGWVVGGWAGVRRCGGRACIRAVETRSIGGTEARARRSRLREHSRDGADGPVVPAHLYASASSNITGTMANVSRIALQSVGKRCSGGQQSGRCAPVPSSGPPTPPRPRLVLTGC